MVLIFNDLRPVPPATGLNGADKADIPADGFVHNRSTWMTIKVGVECVLNFDELLRKFLIAEEEILWTPSSKNVTEKTSRSSPNLSSSVRLLTDTAVLMINGVL